MVAGSSPDDTTTGSRASSGALVAAFAGERLEVWAGVRSGAGPVAFHVSVVDQLSEVVVRHRFPVNQAAACPPSSQHCHAVVQVSGVQFFF